jgi:hypothetical protein
MLLIKDAASTGFVCNIKCGPEIKDVCTSGRIRIISRRFFAGETLSSVPPRKNIGTLITLNVFPTLTPRIALARAAMTLGDTVPWAFRRRDIIEGEP